MSNSSIQLWTAATKNEINQVKEILKNNQNINFQLAMGEFQDTILTSVARNGHTEVLQGFFFFFFFFFFFLFSFFFFLFLFSFFFFLFSFFFFLFSFFFFLFSFFFFFFLFSFFF